MKNAIFVLVVLLVSTNCFADEHKENLFSTPQEVIHEYCDLWFEADYENMYSLLSRTVHRNLSFEDYEEMRILEETKIGLPKKCTIKDQLQNLGSKSLWSINITYENTIVGDITSNSWCEKRGKTWRISEGGLINGILKNPFF